MNTNQILGLLSGAVAELENTIATMNLLAQASQVSGTYVSTFGLDSIRFEVKAFGQYLGEVMKQEGHSGTEHSTSLADFVREISEAAVSESLSADHVTDVIKNLIAEEVSSSAISAEDLSMELDAYITESDVDSRFEDYPDEDRVREIVDEVIESLEVRASIRRQY
jgi:hypothetical protein